MSNKLHIQIVGYRNTYEMKKGKQGKSKKEGNEKQNRQGRYTEWVYGRPYARCFGTNRHT